MSVLLETSLGDLVIDLDVEGSPALVDNFVRLCQARYYTQTLLFRLPAGGRCVYGGDPCGDGTGGACAKALEELYTTNADSSDNDETARLQASPHRFLTSQGHRRLTKEECRERGRVVAVELQGVANTVGSQFLITIGEGEGQALDGYEPYGGTTTSGSSSSSRGWLSLGKVVEDNNHVLEQLDRMSRYEMEDRPASDIRVRRALIVYYAPLERQPQQQEAQKRLLWSKSFLEQRGVLVDDNDRVVRSPSPPRPPTERVTPRIPIEQVQRDLQKNNSDDEDPEERRRRLRAEADQDRRFEDKSRARVLEMLGDLPDAEARAPKNVLFVAKLNPITTDEDLQLIFSRFDPNVTVDIIRDHDTGQSLQYAFCAFSTEKQALEAYFKMNQALVDDRRILVDFSQSVAHVWDKYRQRYRNMPKTPHQASGHPPARRPGDNKQRYTGGSGGESRRQDSRRENRGWQHEPRRGAPRHRGEEDRRLYGHPDERRQGHHHKREEQSDRYSRDRKERRHNDEEKPRDYDHRGHHRQYENERYHRDERTTRRERFSSHDSNEERHRKHRRHENEREEHSRRRYDSDNDSSEEQRHRKQSKRKEEGSRRRRHHHESDEDSKDSRRRKKRRKRHRSENDERRRRERKHHRHSRHHSEEGHDFRRREEGSHGDISSSLDYHDSRDREYKDRDLTSRRRRMDSDIED